MVDALESDAVLRNRLFDLRLHTSSKVSSLDIILHGIVAVSLSKSLRFLKAAAAVSAGSGGRVWDSTSIALQQETALDW
ncbi:hypothetical protein MTO96_029734 [Rhipicephalus appendiculatus]